MPSTTIVISEIYGGGGSTGSPYQNDFVELHNLTSIDIVLDGYSIQYASAGGSTWQVTSLTGTIPANGYFLVQEAAGGTPAGALPTSDSSGNISFSTTTGKVALVDNSVRLSGSAPSDSAIVDFVGYGPNANASETAPASGASNTMSISRLDSGNTDTDNNSADFAATSPNPQNTQSPVCFDAGTRILTACGEVAVEHLSVGDLAVTASGAHRPIRWIGSRLIDTRRYSDPAAVMPVRIRAGALGENRPARDLVVSPDHTIGLDVAGEVLIPAIALVNGSTIVQEEVDSVAYWHVELDSHDLLIAEGQAAESYLDMGNRAFFAENGVIDLSALPDAADAAARTHADFCRPFHGGGALVDVVRSQVRLRAEALGWTRATPEAWADVHLEVDGAVVLPKTRGLAARFVVPADARDLWLVCPTSIPSQVGDSADLRALGLCLSGLTLDDGLGAARTITPEDPLLCVGFYAADPGHRWTTGRARLPAALLEGLEGDVFLRLDLAGSRPLRWVAPQVAALAETPVTAPRLRLVAA